MWYFADELANSVMSQIMLTCNEPSSEMLTTQSQIPE